MCPFYVQLLFGVVFACVVVSAVDCGPPENPYNGNAVFTSTSYNSVVSYECKYGYILSGEPTRRCGADGKWSGTTPKCQGNCKNENLKLIPGTYMCNNVREKLVKGQCPNTLKLPRRIFFTNLRII